MAFQRVKLSNFRSIGFKLFSFFTPGRAPAIERSLPWIQNKSEKKHNYGLSTSKFTYQSFTMGSLFKQTSVLKCKDVFRPDPLIHRLVGMLLFRRMLKLTKVSFNLKEFSSGVKEAIKVVADFINAKDQEKLENLLGSALYRQYTIAFEKLKLEKKDIFLKVAASKSVQISGARFVFGDTKPGDEYIMTAFGQKIILSKSEMEDFMDEKGGNMGAMDNITFGKQFGEAALQKRIRFQFDVKFQLMECYKVLPENYTLSEKEKNQFEISYHKWKFETPILTGIGLPSENVLDWAVVDVDDYLQNKYKAEIIEE